MMNCPACGRLMEYRGTFVRSTFYCPVCHHCIIVTQGFSSSTTTIPGLLSGFPQRTFPLDWEDPPARIAVPQAFQDAFEKEVLEP